MSESMTVSQAHEQLNLFKAEIGKALLGQDDVLENTLIALVAAGHVLIEGVPGLGKTLLVSALAKCFSGNFKRIQFTPDLMPSDVTGHTLYDMKSETFKIRKGPVFTNLLLADEINRAPAKTQSALLEVMQEGQVTIEGTAMPVGKPFMVLATQNPIEQEGTYPLPEAELDRFLMKVFIDYPSHDDESAVVKHVTTGQVGEQLKVSDLEAVASTESILQLRQAASQITVDEQVLDYAVRLVRATREWPGLIKGAGPRGSIALIRCARARALLDGVDFVTPDHIKAVTKPVLRHRIGLSADLEIEGSTTDQVLDAILQQIESPKQ